MYESSYDDTTILVVEGSPACQIIEIESINQYPEKKMKQTSVTNSRSAFSQETIEEQSPEEVPQKLT